MPRKCLACSSSERAAIDKAIVAGEPLRNIAKRVSISPAALVRHKSHVAGAIAKAQERREEKLGDTIFDEMKRVLAKAWELLGKMELAGDYRGAIVAAREVRECLESLNGLVTKAEGGSGGIKVIVQHMGANPAIDQLKRPIEIEAVPTPSDGDETAPVAPVQSDETERGPAQNYLGNSAVTPSGQAQNSLQPSSSTVPLPPASQSKGFAIMPPEPPRRRFLTRTGAAMAFLRGGGSR